MFEIILIYLELGLVVTVVVMYLEQPPAIRSLSEAFHYGMSALLSIIVWPIVLRDLWRARQ